MKGLILVLIIVLYIIYFNYSLVSKKIDSKLIYVIGVYKNAVVDKKIANNIAKLAEERNIDMIIKLYDNYFNLTKDLNSFVVDFAIVPEDYYMDSYLGLNVFKGDKLLNNRFMVGAYFNNFYMISDIYFKDNSRETLISSVSDIIYFKKIYTRNYIIGTEEIDSNSFLSLILILKMYNFTPVMFNKIDINKEYDDNVVFVITENKEQLYTRYINKKVDGIFILDISYSRFISYIATKQDALFLNFDLDNTSFDDLLSNIYYKKNININQFYTTKIHSNFSKDGITPNNNITYYNNVDEDEFQHSIGDTEKELDNILTTRGKFDSRMIRYNFITNTSVNDDLVYKLTDMIIRNNNYIINKSLYNKFSNIEHGLFEPADIIYLNSNLPYHNGSKKLYMELKFVTYNKQDIKAAEADSDDKFDYYWKYSKIGFKKFNFKE
jgi:hypothetical protein